MKFVRCVNCAVQRLEPMSFEEFFGSSTEPGGSAKNMDCGYILFYQARELSGSAAPALFKHS